MLKLKLDNPETKSRTDVWFAPTCNLFFAFREELYCKLKSSVMDLFKQLNHASLCKMTKSVGLTSGKRPPVTNKLIVNVECGSQSILKYKLFLIMLKLSFSYGK